MSAYSVVVAVYNSEGTLATCLRSVLAQTLLPLEVVVVDDASTDGTGIVAQLHEKDFAAAGVAFKYIRFSSNRGPSAARNAATREASGDYIAFLDADDAWSPHKLAVVNSVLKTRNVGLICHCYTSGRELAEVMGGYTARRLSLWGILARNPAQTSCSVLRRQSQLRFDERMRYHEDHDLWVRVAEREPAIVIVGPPLTRLGRPQLSKGGLSGNTTRMRGGEMQVYYNFCTRDPVRRLWLLLPLVCFSVAKHGYSWLHRKVIVRF